MKFCFSFILVFICSLVFSQNSLTPKQLERLQKELKFEADYLDKRNSVSVRKLMAWTFTLNDNDSGFEKFQINDFSIMYTRLFGKRWNLGVGFYQTSEHFVKKTGFLTNDLSENSDIIFGPTNFYSTENGFFHTEGVGGRYTTQEGYLSASRQSKHLRISVSYDIIQKRFLIVRASGYLSLFLTTDYYAGAAPIKGNKLQLTNELLFITDGTRFGERPLGSLGLDFIYPLKGIHDVGISTQIAPANNPKLGLYVFFNYRF